MKSNPQMKALILEVVENQLRDNDPQETKETFDRLVAKGYTKQQAKEMIGAIVVEEIWDTMKQNKMFDKDKFVKKLAQLK